MIYYKTEEEIELIRESSLLVGKALAEVAKLVKPGVTSSELDEVAETCIRDHGGIPGFKDYRGFPNTLCVSKNEAVVHGIPDDKPLEDGDVLSVDCGVLMNKFYGDSAFTFEVGEIEEDVKQLLKVTKESLYKGIEMAKPGYRLGDIGYAIQSHAEQAGYSVVRELVGHGLGKELHEKPEVPNYGRRGKGGKLKKGLVIAIEPMVNMGKKEVKQAEDGWTIITKDRKPSAHFEHTIVITKKGNEILTTFDYIEQVLNNN